VLTKPGPTPNSGKPGAPPFAGWTAPLQLAGGAWSIAGLPWNLQVRRLPDGKIDAELLDPPQVPAGQEASPHEAGVLAILKSMASAKRTEHGYHVYLFNFVDARAVLFTRLTPAGERLTLGRIVYAGADGTRFLFEASPQPGDLAAAAPQAPELLVLPKGTLPLATRRDAKGATLAELATVTADLASLKKLWQQDGYRTEASASPSKAMRGVTCWKNDQAVQVWLWPSAGGTNQTLLLQIRLSAEVLR